MILILTVHDHPHWACRFQMIVYYCMIDILAIDHDIRNRNFSADRFQWSISCHHTCDDHTPRVYWWHQHVLQECNNQLWKIWLLIQQKPTTNSTKTWRKCICGTYPYMHTSVYKDMDTETTYHTLSKNKHLQYIFIYNVWTVNKKNYM